MRKTKSNVKSNIIITIIIVIVVALIFFLCWLKLGNGAAKDAFLSINDNKNSVGASSQELTESKTTENQSSELSTSEKSSSDTTVTTTTTTTTTTTKKTDSTYPYAYAGMNPVITNTSVPFNRLLVNRDYILPDSFSVSLSTLSEIGSYERLDSRVVPYYIKMYRAAQADGITLTPVSGYRTIERQRTNYENRIARYQSQGYSKAEAADLAAQVILPPGTSEHNAGLAMDIISLETSFENTAAFRWLTEHAADYGFIMRYPKDKTHITKITYEPWHWRYVGVDMAKEIKASGKTLEEYLGVA